MRKIKYIVFLSILGSLFLVIYSNSNQKGLRRLRTSFTIAVAVAAILSGLILSPTIKNNEKLLEANTQKITFVKDNSFFKEGFQQPYPQRSSSRITTGIEESNPVCGGVDSSAPSSGNSDRSCQTNHPAPKAASEV
ncbi:MAG: hypothetical protein ACI83B_003645 [Sediminicola sp.]|jgi:hypothetical protein